VVFATFTVGVLGQVPKTPARLASIPELHRQADLRSDLHSVTVSRILTEALLSTYVPGGVALLVQNGEEHHYSFELPARSLEDVLKAIGKTEPRYQWEFVGGVVNLYPKENYAVLNARVYEFDVEKVTKEDAVKALMQKADFMRTQAAAEVAQFPYSCCGGLCTNDPARNISVHLKNATVHDILNEIVRQNGRSTWLYEELASNDTQEGTKRYYRLSFLVNFEADCGHFL
jgi:hypothetical protein